MQLERITSSNSRSVVVTDIFRPPKCSLPEILDEIADVTSIYTASNDRLVLCDDDNYPGVDGTSIDDSLASLLDSLRLDQLVTSPTRDDNLLDILATDTAESLSDVEIDDAGYISDHRLVHANLILIFLHRPDDHRHHETMPRTRSCACLFQIFSSPRFAPSKIPLIARPHTSFIQPKHPIFDSLALH